MLRLLLFVCRNMPPIFGLRPGPDLADDVAVRGFHLDDVRAEIAELKGRVRPHQDRGQVEDADAAQRAGQMVFMLVDNSFRHATIVNV